MGLADFYFEKQKNFEVKIDKKPSDDLKYIVVIPCFNEYFLLDTLNSIKECEKPKGSIEVIVVLNSSESSEQQIIDQNKKTYDEVKNWIHKESDSSFLVYILSEENITSKLSGAGYARKIGMDQAAYRFHTMNNTEGLIVSLDADSKLKSNYFIELDKQLDQFPKTIVVTSYFEHPITGDEFKAEVYDAITIYELYLRYYKLALKYTGFPYSFYTIGSCFSVNVKAYIKQGGMNSKLAGEDFYFLHKIFPLGQCYEINSTCVYPSSRPSDRVPFGTGPMVQSIVNSNSEFLSYDFKAFSDLKKLFQVIDQFYRLPTNELSEIFYQLPLSVVDFLSINDIHTVLEEINDNSSSMKAFIKRFYDWFNAFRILKYLNASTEKFYPKKALIPEVDQLLNSLKKGKPQFVTSKSYLELLRSIERGF